MLTKVQAIWCIGRITTALWGQNKDNMDIGMKLVNSSLEIIELEDGRRIAQWGMSWHVWDWMKKPDFPEAPALFNGRLYNAKAQQVPNRWSSSTLRSTEWFIDLEVKIAPRMDLQSQWSNLLSKEFWKHTRSSLFPLFGFKSVTKETQWSIISSSASETCGANNDNDSLKADPTKSGNWGCGWVNK